MRFRMPGAARFSETALNAKREEASVTLQRKLALGVAAWLAAVTLLHLWLNTRLFDPASGEPGQGGVRFRVGFLPVT
jgi:hypothetical protein